MSEKHNNTIKKDNKNTNEVNILVDKKIELFKDIIQRTILHVQRNKTLDILGVSDISTCIDKLNEISNKNNNTFISYDNNIDNNIDNSIDNNIDNLFHIPTVCYSTDDIWISSYLASRGYIYIYMHIYINIYNKIDIYCIS